MQRSTPKDRIRANSQLNRDTRTENIPRRVTFRLGWRLLRAVDRRRLLSMGLVIGGVAMATVSVLSGIAAVRTVQARADRTAARALLEVGTSAAAGVGTSATARAWVEQNRMPYGKRMVLRIDVDLAEDPLPPPPGLSRWPGEGEAIVSPAFREALRQDPALASYAPATLRGLIGEPGLHSPDELIVYRGVDRADLPRGGNVVLARSGQPATALALDRREITNGQLAGLVAVFAVLVGLPLIAFLSVAARLSATTRARRLAALHLLGVPGRTLGVVNAVEVSALSLLGSALGLLVYPGVNVLLSGSGVLGIVWFPVDTALTGPLTVSVLAVTAALAALAARRAGGDSNLTTTRTRIGQAHKPSTWRLIPLGVGLTSLGAQVAAGALRRPDQSPLVHLDTLMLTAVLTTGIGLLLAAPALTYLAGDLAHRRGRTLAARLGGARAAFDPTSAARLVAGLSLLVFALGVAIGQTRDARAVSTPQTPVVDITVSVAEIPPGAVSSLFGSSPAPVALELSTPPGPDEQLEAIVVGCAQLVAFAGHGVQGTTADSGCQDDTVYWAPDVHPNPSLLRALPLSNQTVGSLRLATMPPVLARLLDTDVLITIPDLVAVVSAQGPNSPSGQKPTADDSRIPQYSDAALVVFRAPRADVDRTLAYIYAHAPYSQPSTLGLDPDSGENIAIINGYIRLGMIGGVLMALLALATALADRATERRRADHELLAGGAPRHLIRRTHLWEVAATVVSSLATAALAGVLGGLAWQYAGGLTREPDTISILALLAFAVLGGGLAITAASAMAPTELDPAVLRSE